MQINAVYLHGWAHHLLSVACRLARRYNAVELGRFKCHTTDHWLLQIAAVRCSLHVLQVFCQNFCWRQIRPKHILFVIFVVAIMQRRLLSLNL